ncbi:hypothetical protein [Blastococcus sp. SYSU D01042]
MTSRGRRVCVAVVAAAMLPLLAPAAARADIVVGTGPYEATRGSDGTTTLHLTVWNLNAEDVELSLTASRCEAPAVAPTVEALRQGEATFEMRCEEGDEERAATLTTAPDGPAGTTTVDFSFSIAQPPDPAPGPLWFFALAGLLGLVAVVPPYAFWKTSPRGNPERPVASGATQEQKKLSRVWATLSQRGEHHLGSTLPGITADWSFTDTWASNAGLATALFTGLFAATDPLEIVLGTDSSQAQSTIVIASALAAGLIGAAPLLLVICKRRFEKEGGVARHNTIGGVLAASWVVITASTGLVLAAAAALDRPWPWVIAVAVCLLLLVYSWKSVPQTLALGSFPVAEGAEARPPAIGGPGSRRDFTVAAMP